MPSLKSSYWTQQILGLYIFSYFSGMNLLPLIEKPLDFRDRRSLTSRLLAYFLGFSYGLPFSLPRFIPL